MSQGNTGQGIAHEKTMEQGLWRAVIAGTIAEWFSGPLSRRREAEAYLSTIQPTSRRCVSRRGWMPHTCAAG